MERSESSEASGVAERLVRVHEVLDLCISRRLRGEPVPDEQVIAEHPELLPELAHELRGLAMIERARRSATSRSRNGHSSSLGGVASAGGAARAAALIPGYEIVKPIHSGAQGVVYQALQRSTQRMVALKVMRAAAPDGLRELSRFEREVQILATLRHPNIVAIHDSGLTPDGRAYFVMDFIEGQPLDEWVAALRGESGRTDPERIEAFLRVFSLICDAVHAAHLRGVIHRDIKPANIRIDASGQPHVLDFGLAKNVGEPTDSEMTVTGQFIGSLPWASPEQAEGAIEKIDVRTDVYALGVVLFGGLTGQFPYDVGGPMRDVLERIISAEPRRPSSYRRASGRQASIGDDLDTIALKCLSKEPDRRYQSAGELARDIRAYLSGEPIEARRNSAFYLLRKQMGRYRAALAAGLATVLVISGLAGYAGVQARESRDRAVAEQKARRAAEEATAQANTAREEASRLFEQATVARLAESEQRQLSEREAERARSVTNFLVRTLGMADPDVTQGADLSLRTLLDGASVEIHAAFSGQPASEATVRLVLGRAYAALGELESAQDHLESCYATRREADAEDWRELYEVLWPYAQVLEDLGDERWREVFWELVRTNRLALVREFPNLATVLEKVAAMSDEFGFDPVAVTEHRNTIHDALDQLIEKTDQRWMLVADWSALNGANQAFKGRPKYACEMLRDALEIQRRFLAETNTRIVRTLGSLVDALIEDEQYAEAERITLEALTKILASLKEDHWYVAALRSRLAASLIGLGRLDEADEILRDATQRLDVGLVDFSRHRMQAQSYAAWVADARGQADQGDELRRDVARKLAAEFRAGNRFDLLRYAVRRDERAKLSVLHEMYANLGERTAVEERAIAKVFAAQRELFADDDPRSTALGDLYYRVGRARVGPRGYDKATVQLFEESERLSRVATCLNPWKRACSLFGMALVHENKERFEPGENCAREALAIVESEFGEERGFASALRSVLSACISGQGRHEEAAPLALRSFDELLSRWGAPNRETRRSLHRLARVYAAMGRPQDAMPAMRRLSYGYRVAWSTLRPALAASYPDLTRALDNLRDVPPRDETAITEAVTRVLGARQAAFDVSHPDAVLYEDAAYEFADAHMMIMPSAAWAPLFRDFVNIESALFSPPRKTKASRLWWYAVALLEGGAFEEAEGPARESSEITRRFDAIGARSYAGRAVVLARTLAGQGRATEALPLLEGSIEPLAGRMDNRNAVQFVAALLDVYSALGRRAAMTETLVPYLERVLAQSNDATFLNHVVSRLSAQGQLDPVLRGLTVQLARRATEIRPNDPLHWRALTTAAEAAGDEQTAAEARRNLTSPSDSVSN